jgi:hypothetical protein
MSWKRDIDLIFTLIHQMIERLKANFQCFLFLKAKRVNGRPPQIGRKALTSALN